MEIEKEIEAIREGPFLDRIILSLSILEIKIY